MERAASADFQRDVHVLFEQMYDAIEKRIVDRDALRDLTDNLSDVIMPLTMVAAIPVLKAQFSRQELNNINLTPVEALVVSILEKNFGKVVTKDALRAAITARNPHKDASDNSDPKLVDVHICKIRAKLNGTPYGIRTDWAVGYSMDAADKCLISAAAIASRARANSRPKWRGMAFTPAGVKIMAYLEANKHKFCSVSEIMTAVPECKTRSTVNNVISRARQGTMDGAFIVSRHRSGWRLVETK